MESIRELRSKTGLTQKAFADTFGIPVSTLRKWEQGESSPPPYVCRLLARALPVKKEDGLEVKSPCGQTFYCLYARNSVMDEKGNEILVQEDLHGVDPQNMIIYLEDLFEDFEHIQTRFNQDCYYDKREHFHWTR